MKVGQIKMRVLFCIFIFLSAIICGAAEQKIPGGWTESGTLQYSYAYARSYIGHQMRKEGWVCKIAFTAGAQRNQEHSVWHKGNKKMQIMIWRIDSGITGYSKGEIAADKQGNGR